MVLIFGKCFIVLRNTSYLRYQTVIFQPIKTFFKQDVQNLPVKNLNILLI